MAVPRPSFAAVSLAMARASPVTILTVTPICQHLLFEIVAAGAELREPVDHVLDQVEAVQAVLYPHSEGGGDRSSG